MLAGLRHASNGLPGRAVAFQVGHEGRIDDVVLEGVDEDGRHEATVLPCLVDDWIRRPCEDDLLRDPEHLIVKAITPEDVRVDVGFPLPEPRAGSRAQSATLDATSAVLGTAFSLNVKGLVAATSVVVSENVIRGHDDAGGTARAKAGRDHLLEQVGPVGSLWGHAGLLTSVTGRVRSRCRHSGSRMSLKPLAQGNVMLLMSKSPFTGTSL